ncbi:MAG: protein kinase, partial [Syntrophomonadaceae bacterium]
MYRALDRSTGDAVALKTLRDGNVEALFRLKREFRALADLSHPNLVALHELLAEGDQWFVTMELIEGVNFIDYVRGAPLRAVADSTDRTEAPRSPGRGVGGEHSLPSGAAAGPPRLGLSPATDTDIPVAPAFDTIRLR